MIPISTPFENLLTAIDHIEKLHHAHGQIIEGGAANSQWINDRPSIFIKSGIALLCAGWEAFVEESAEEALKFLVANVKTPLDLPLLLRKKIAKELKEDQNDLAVWQLANNGWHDVARMRYENTIRAQMNLMNTPKPSKIKELYSNLLGVDDITSNWEWDGFEHDTTINWVTKFVEARGAIAHGKDPEFPIGCFALHFFTELIIECSCKINNHLRYFLNKSTSKLIWKELRSQTNWNRYSSIKENLPDFDCVVVYRSGGVDPYYATAEP